jgi:hypothetical protein
MKRRRSGKAQKRRAATKNEARDAAGSASSRVSDRRISVNPVSFELEIERWVRMKAPQMGAVLAVRAALRALPVLDTLSVNFQPITLQTFRASAIGWAACRYRTEASVLAQRAINAANSVFVAATAADRLRAFATATVARSAGHAAIAATDSLFDRALSDPKAIDAIKGATDVAIASAFDDGSFDLNRTPAIRIPSTVVAVLADMQAMDTGTNPSALVSKPLWPKEFPDWAREAWLRLAATLRNTGDDWDVWIDWYDERLHGRPSNQSLELDRAMIDDGVWSGGPEIVNAYIKRLVRRDESPDPNDDEAMEEWLVGSPSEWGSVLAARIALRALAFFAFDKPNEPEREDNFTAKLLIALRVAAASRYVAEHPDCGFLLAGAIETVPKEEHDEPLSSLAMIFEAASAAYAGNAADVNRIIGLANDSFVMQYEIHRDAQDLQRGMPPEQLANAPLWRSSEPGGTSDITRHVARFAKIRRRFGSHWRVWIRWYRHVLDGGFRDLREVAFVDLPKPLPWDEGPEAVNTAIAKRLSTDPPEPLLESAALSIPPQFPAAIEPVWSRNILTLPKERVKTDLDGRKFTSALRALHADLETFADDLSVESNIDRRFVVYVRSLAARIPQKSPRQDELFRLGHAAEIFSLYAQTVRAEWPEILFAKYQALILHFERVMRQSPLWREFKRNAEQQTLTPEQVAAAPQLAAQLASALRDTDAEGFVDPGVADALEQLAAAQALDADTLEASADAAEARERFLAIDLIESINNIFKRLAEVAVNSLAGRSAKEYATNLVERLPESFGKLGREHADKIPKWLFRVATGAAAIYLANFPRAFAWFMEHVVPLLPR